LAIVIVVITVVMGFVIYVLFFKPAEKAYVNVNGQLIPVDVFPTINLNVNKGVKANINAFTGIPEIDKIANGRNTLTETLNTDIAQNATRANDGKSMQYYNAEDGKFYRIDENGNKVLMTDEIFKGVANVNWSNDSNAAVLEMQDGYNIYYDFNKKKQYSLPKEMEDFSFSPDNQQIAYKYMALDKEDRALGVINPDGSGVTSITGLGENADKVQVNWSPSGQAVATFQDYVDSGRQKVVPIGLHGENYKQMLVEGRDFQYQWDTTGQKMLYSIYNAESDFKPSLWIVDAQGEQIGENRINLQINTWQDKCTFGSSSTIYCAVPSSLDKGSGISRGVADNTPDSIYKIDLTTGAKSILAVPVDATGTTQYTIDSLYTSTDGATLFFTDKNNKNIHKIKLK